MPEGHTIHRLAREHTALLRGEQVRTSSRQGRFAAGAARLNGATLVAADAHGKHLFHTYRTSGGEPLQLHVHLGLYGGFTSGPPPAPSPVGQVRLRIVGDSGYLDLRGPTACELVSPAEKQAFHDRLGADPLRPDADSDAAAVRVLRSRTAIAQLLMDQSVVAGVGAVYRAEVLFRQGVDPYRQGRSMDRGTVRRIWEDLVGLMRDGVRTGQIDTVRPEHLPEAMGRPPRVDRHGGEVYVYRRAGQPCLACDTPVRAGVLASRNLYWCPSCQRP
ncbi:MAG: Fpg/Nei family DNA glycosylase [Micromonosporaceae bacterium]